MAAASVFPTWGLYALTREGYASTTALLEAVAAALAGGVVAIQYRDKRKDPSARAAAARGMLELCRQRDVPLIINDDVALAAAIAAAGAHVGRQDIDLRAARDLLGPDAIIGVSCYDSIERARRAAGAGANYVAFGSFYPSQTKPGATPCSIEVLREARACLSIPIVAIGGITPENGAALLCEGAGLLAVVNGVFAHPDPCAAAQAYTLLFRDPENGDEI